MRDTGYRLQKIYIYISLFQVVAGLYPSTCVLLTAKLPLSSKIQVSFVVFCYRGTGCDIVTHTAPSWSGWSVTCITSGPWRNSSSSLVWKRVPLPAAAILYRRPEAFRILCCTSQGASACGYVWSSRYQICLKGKGEKERKSTCG